MNVLKALFNSTKWHNYLYNASIKVLNSFIDSNSNTYLHIVFFPTLKVLLFIIDTSNNLWNSRLKKKKIILIKVQ